MNMKVKSCEKFFVIGTGQLSIRVLSWISVVAAHQSNIKHIVEVTVLYIFECTSTRQSSDGKRKDLAKKSTPIGMRSRIINVALQELYVNLNSSLVVKKYSREDTNHQKLLKNLFWSTELTSASNWRRSWRKSAKWQNFQPG